MRPTPASMLAALSGLAALAALAGGCAKPGPPGGGPPDEEPPFVVRTTPGDGSVLVDRSTPVEVEFSEEMNRPAVERSLQVVPRVDLRNLRWKGRTLLIEPAQALPESTTVVVEIGASAQDYHNVPSARAFSFAFSTGPSIDKGIVDGVVTSGGDPVAGYMVWACSGVVAPDSAGVLYPCGYPTTTGDGGRFRFANLRVAQTPYSLVAFHDVDGDGRYATWAETGGMLMDAALIAVPGDSVGGLVVPVAPPATRAAEEARTPEKREEPAGHAAPSDGTLPKEVGE